MQDVNSVKSQIEQVNIAYLCKNFTLIPFSYEIIQEEGVKPDLYGPGENGKPQCIFELKSRTYPKNQTGRIRPKTDYEWWRADAQQIRDYETLAEKLGIDLVWVFVLSYVSKPLTRTDKISETIIREREIYIVPWKVHELVSITPKRGVKNMGLSKIKKQYKFIYQTVKKGKLLIAKNIEERVKEFFD
ncbi:hypothetical protein JW851_03255 [Candidatus Woesearchaeota archaeon]|nr:hypothetical protein [Candidatus Woesearchaeota archaeon]